MERLKQTPVVGQAMTLLDTYPRISGWIVLSIGIVGLLVYEARDVGLSTGNWAALIIASIVVAGLCIWIVSWEDDTETAESDGILVSSRKRESTEAAAVTSEPPSADTPPSAS